MQKANRVYEFGRVQHILDYVRSLQEIAYDYAYSPDPGTRAEALADWRRAAAEMNLHAGPVRRSVASVTTPAVRRTRAA